MSEEGLKETANRQIHIGQPIQFDEEQFFVQLNRLKAAAESESPDIREYVRKIVPTYTVKGNQNHEHEQDSTDTVFTEGLALQPDHARG